MSQTLACAVASTNAKTLSTPVLTHPTLHHSTLLKLCAYSCNYYFATVGEQLDGTSFASLLSEFGFGQPTGVNDAKESAGGLARGRWQPESAIGEGEFLQVTPIQLAMAYAALFNGGKLFRPTTAPADFTPRLRAATFDQQ